MNDEHRSLSLRICNSFLILHTIDTLVTAADELHGWLTGNAHQLYVVREPVALLTLMVASLTWAAMALSPRVPRLAFLPASLFLLWATWGALPFPVSAPHRLPLILVIGQCLTTLVMFTAVRRRSGGWFLSEQALGEKAPRFGHTAGFLVAHGALLPLLFAGLALFSLGGYVEKQTNGFVTFDRSGINLAERRYARAGREIRLVGMMHIGEGRGYREIFDSFQIANTVVLEEGVSDEDDLLDGFSYHGAATTLGLQAQPPLGQVLDEIDAEIEEATGEPAAREWPHHHRADLDVSDFSASTVEFLNRVGKVWSATGLMAQMAELSALASDPHAEEWNRLFFADLVDKRNHHLEGEITNALVDYTTVVVPWGALHLPGIETTVTGWGLALTASTERRLLSYATVLGALAGRPPQPEEQR